MEVDSVEATRVERQVPFPIRLRTYIVVPVFLFIIWGAIFQDRNWVGAVVALAVLAAFFLLNQGMDQGYQLAFDDTRLYQRPKGWRRFFRRLPWYSVSYDELNRMETIFGSDADMKRRFFPFEFILLFGRSGAQGDNVVIYPPAFRDSSLKEFLRFLYSRRPDVFTDEVKRFIGSDQPL